MPSQRHLSISGTPIWPVNESICERAMHLIDRHALGDGLRLADALIAATALEHGLPLLTGNVKHCRSLPGLLKKEEITPRHPAETPGGCGYAALDDLEVLVGAPVSLMA